MKKKNILIIVAVVVFVVIVFLRVKDNLQIFKTEKGNTDIVRLKNFQMGQVVRSPIVVEGEARGMWFFEASFPVVLVDWDGKIIAQDIATAQSDWMTENFVPFKATLKFAKPDDIGDFSKKGALILQKDNPSGLPEHDDVLEIPVVFE